MGKNKSIQRIHTAGGQGTVQRGVLDPISLGTDGSIFINTARLAAPTTVYDADVAWVVRRPGSVSLFFAKEDFDNSSQLYSRLEIRYPDETFVEQFVKNSREFHAGLKDLLLAWKDQPAYSPAKFQTMPAARSHSEWVNFDHLARAGSQASLDFYHLSPAGLARYMQKQGSSGLDLVPRVRVLTTVFQLDGLLDGAMAIVEDVRRCLPDAVITPSPSTEPDEEQQ